MSIIEGSAVAPGAVARRAAVTPGMVLAQLCCAYAAAACLVIPQTYWSVLNAYPITRYFFLAPLLVLVGVTVAAFVHRPRAPLSFVREKFASRGRGMLLILGVLIVSATAFTALKHEYSNWLPFFADTLLADLDEAMHGGQPWRIARAVFPPSAEPVLFTLYLQMWFVQLLGMIVLAAFLEDERTRVGYLFAFAVTIIVLGTVVRIGGSSAGPIFYDRLFGGDRYADLLIGLQSTDGGRGVLTVADYLYRSYAADRTVLGTGISAMPSLHVAVAVLNALFVSSLSRFWGAGYWLYAAAIMFGSVYFGWHYALDGYVSIAFVLLAWRFRHLVFRLADWQNAMLARIR